jgi:Fe-S cluster assembly protein SufD
MTLTTTPAAGLRGRQEAFARAVPAPDWIAAIRARGLAEVEARGLPSLRDEEWRFTNPDRLRAAELAPGPGDAGAIDPAALEAWRIAGLDGPRLVFVDGVFAPSLSRIGTLPEGVVCGSLAAAVRDRRDLVEPHLDRPARERPEALTSLNAAFLADGLFVHVPDGVEWDAPVHALFVTTPGVETLASPRNLVVAGRSARAVVVEDYVSLDGSAALTNAVTEVVTGDASTCHHYVLERESDAALAVTTVHAEQGRDSTFQSHSALLGGAVVRNNVYPVLRGPGGWCLLNGFYVPRGRQHHDTFMVVRHAAPHCDSRQFYRGILDDRSRAVFSGRIVVHEGAQKTDAKQTNRNLLLSDDALIDTKPQLEIYADDVKCTHGATVGQLDPEEIFYFRARGIPEALARGLLTFAFVNEVIDRMELKPVQEALRRSLRGRLPGVRADGNGA